MPAHYAQANTQHLMMLSTRLVENETRQRVELEQQAAVFMSALEEQRRVTARLAAQLADLAGANNSAQESRKIVDKKEHVTTKQHQH
jgi:hypothetical protein